MICFGTFHNPLSYKIIHRMECRLNTSSTSQNVTLDIVAKLWNLCNVLKDDGVTYHQYVTELTYFLFLKMAKETGTEDQLPRVPLG